MLADQLHWLSFLTVQNEGRMYDLFDRYKPIFRYTSATRWIKSAEHSKQCSKPISCSSLCRWHDKILIVFLDPALFALNFRCTGCIVINLTTWVSVLSMVIYCLYVLWIAGLNLSSVYVDFSVLAVVIKDSLSCSIILGVIW